MKNLIIILLIFNLFLATNAKKSKKSSFTLEILSPQIAHPIVYKSGKLTKNFDSEIYLKKTDCTTGNLQIIEFQQKQGDQLITFHYSKADLKRQNIHIQVEPNKNPKPILQNLNRIYKEFVINARCPDHINNKNYYNRVTVSLKFQGTSKYQQFSFLLNCDLMDYHKNFEVGYLFIAIICCGIVFLTSLHPRIHSLRIQNIPINIEIKWQGFIMIMVIIIGCIGLSYFQRITSKDIYYYGLKKEALVRIAFIYSLLKHIGLIFSIIFVFICANQLFFEYSSLLKSFNFIGLKLYGLFIPKNIVISLSLALISYLVSLFVDNWVLYNMLSFMIVVGAIKVFRFRSLRNATYSMIIMASTVMIASIWAHFYLPRSYNDYATELSSPIFIEIPDFVNNLYKKCSWICVIDLIFPGAIIAYLRDYDNNLNMERGQGLYSYIAMVSYGLGTFIWVLIEAFTNQTIPFCVIVYPIFINAIILSAHLRNELSTIWQGRFHYSVDLAALQVIQNYRSGNPRQLHQLLDLQAFEQIKLNPSSESSSITIRSSNSQELLKK